MLILHGQEVSLDDLISCSKLQSLLSVVVNTLNEQDAAIKQLREREASMGKFRKQVVAALQMCVENNNGRDKLQERLSALEELTTHLPKAEARLAGVEAHVQCLNHELSRVELLVEQIGASIEWKIETTEVENKVARLKRIFETQPAMQEDTLDTETGVANTDKLVTQVSQHVETGSEGTVQRLQQVQTQADLHVKECSSYNGKVPLAEEKGEEDQEIAIAAPKAGTTSSESTIPVGLLFPGQGSQYVMMMSGLKGYPAVTTMLEKARTILGWDVLKLCSDGPEAKLGEPQFCQPVMFIAGLVAMEKLRQDKKEVAERIQGVAGLSVGEYTALCAAGVFSFEDGLKLVDIRGKAMQAASNRSKQAMLSVAGLDKPKLEELCQEARKKEGSSAVCQIANELFPLGFSCAGTLQAIECLKHMSEKAGALHAQILNKHGAFHTCLMASARECVGLALDQMLPRMNPPRYTVYLSSTAEPIKPGTNPKEVVELLKLQITSPAKWESCVRAMILSSVTEFYEVGPLRQLKAMMKRIDSKVWRTTTNVEV